MQKDSLTSKVAIVTGAAKRIGAEIAKSLHDAGMNVVLHYHSSEEEAKLLSQDLNAKRDHSAVAIRADLLDAESGKSLIQQSAKVWNRIDALVNNASRFYRTTFGKITDYAWDDLIKSNLKAPLFLSQAAAPFLSEHQGVIINIADIHAEHPLRNYAVYCISKGGLVMMTKVLAKELGPMVRVNAIAPGMILWPEGENSLSDSDKEKLINHTALLRSGNPRDVSSAVLFFIRDALYVTGQVLYIDGGRTL